MSSNEDNIGRKQYASSGGTSKPAGHLRNKHPRKLRKSSHPGTIPVVRTSPLTAAFERVASAQEKGFTKDSADQLLLNWIIYSNQSFTAIQQKAFREFVKNIQPKYKLPKCADTIRSWVVRNYEDQKQEVRSEIQNAITQIHISIDGWTSPHQSMTVVGLVGHFTIERGGRLSPVLALKEIQGSHTGAALAELVVKVVEE